MIDLGGSEFHLAVPSLPEAELKHLSTKLFDSWESFSSDALSLPDYALRLEVEEGSIRGTARLGVMLGALYVGIGNYGSFVSGIQTITEQIRATGDYLTTAATALFSCPDSRATSRKRGGTLAALQRLFVRVQKGEMAPADAALKAEALLGEDAVDEPQFMNKLRQAFDDCPRFHQQDELPFAEFDVAELINPDNPKTPSSPPKRATELGPPLQLRVEVWRNSKNKRKYTRVIKL